MQVSWRIVIDPNVLVSAAISPAGSPAVLLTLIDAGAITAILSPRLLAELGGVLRRGRFRAWLDLDEVTAYLDELERLAEAVDDPAEVPIVSPDPDDDYLIALARTTNADAVVSGDTDLTGLALADLPTLTPRQLLDELAAARDDPTLGSDQTYVGAVPDEPKEYRMAIPADALAHRRDTTHPGSHVAIGAAVPAPTARSGPPSSAVPVRSTSLWPAGTAWTGARARTTDPSLTAV